MLIGIPILIIIIRKLGFVKIEREKEKNEKLNEGKAIEAQNINTH